MRQGRGKAAVGSQRVEMGSGKVALEVVGRNELGLVSQNVRDKRAREMNDDDDDDDVRRELARSNTPFLACARGGFQGWLPPTATSPAGLVSASIPEELDPSLAVEHSSRHQRQQMNPRSRSYRRCDPKRPS